MENNIIENLNENNIDGVEKPKKFNGYLRKNNRKKKVESIESVEEMMVSDLATHSIEVDKTKQDTVGIEVAKIIPEIVLNEEAIKVVVEPKDEIKTHNSHLVKSNQSKENAARKTFKVNNKKENVVAQKTKKIQNVLKNKKGNHNNNAYNHNNQHHKSRNHTHTNDYDYVETVEIKTPEEIALNALFYTIRKEHNINFFIAAINEHFKYHHDFKQSTSEITVLNYLALYNKDDFLEYIVNTYPIKLFDLNDLNLKTMVKYSMNKSPAIISTTLSLIEKHYENKIPHDILECIIECSTQMMWREDSAKILFNWLNVQLREEDKKLLIEKTIEHTNLTFTYFIYDNHEYSMLLKKVFNQEDDIIKSHPHAKKLTKLIGQSEVAKRIKKEKAIVEIVEDIGEPEEVKHSEHTITARSLTLKKEEVEEDTTSFNDDMFKAKPTITIRRKKKTVG